MNQSQPNKSKLTCNLNFAIMLFFSALLVHLTLISSGQKVSPSNDAINVNPDTHLKINFDSKPQLGKSGFIKIFDNASDTLVDLLDLSIPPGPTSPDTTKGAIYSPVPYKYVSGNFTNKNTKPGTPSGLALPTSDKYQLTIIGRFTDGFHFYPVILNGNSATIYPHNNILDYGKTYYVQIDSEVFLTEGEEFKGIKGKEWSFSTKSSSPSLSSGTLTVSHDGSGDFNTIQGALDFIPDLNPNGITIFIKNGTYEEIVYFRNKSNINIIGENRDSVIIKYANNEVFNPHPPNIKTNELPGTFPSRRAAFAADNCKGLRLENMTIMTTAKGQAEGLLLNGEEMYVNHVTIIGSGDALQTNGSAYFNDCLIIGDGDTVLGRGPTFFKNCELRSFGTFMWIRNTEANHGNVFVNCIFKALGNETEIARTPTNHGKNYPFCEAVLLNCYLSGISPVGWGDVGGDPTNIHYWEFNSKNLSDSILVDTKHRHTASRQLIADKDSILIANYLNPSFVLGGWNPE